MKVRKRLVLDVEYDISGHGPSGSDVASEMLSELVRHAYAEGLLSRDTALEVESHDFTVETVDAAYQGVAAAARGLLDEFGGNTPDYLRRAAASLEAALQARGAKARTTPRLLCEMSTGNIAEEDMELLEEGDTLRLDGFAADLMRAPYQYGAIVSVPSIDSTNGESVDGMAKALAAAGFSQLFVEALNVARDEGFEFVMFDRDAPYASGLKTRVEVDS